MSNVTQFFPGGAGGGGRQIRYALTGPDTQTWTAPPSISVSEVLVICVGGGGRGGDSGFCPFGPGGSSGSGGGGGSGALAGYIYPVGAGTTITLTAGGAGGTSSANNVGPSPVPISASGGSAGSAGNGCGGAPGAGGAGGVASTPGVQNSISVAGRPGSTGSLMQGNAGAGGDGGIITNALSAFGINFDAYIDPQAGQVRAASTTIVLKTADSRSIIGDGGTGGPGCTSVSNFYTLGGSGSPGAVFIYY